MDPVTHGVLGAACAQAILHHKDKHNAWLVGALAGMAPDLDIFIHSAHNPMLLFLYHRSFTHSLIFIPIGAILITLVLSIFKRFRKNWPLTLLAAFIGFATHGLLDAFTNYGTVLFWPFSNQRISWDIVSIIDPFVTIPLFFGVYWTYTFDKKQGALFALLFTSMFFIFNTFQHHRAIVAIKEKIKQDGLVTTNIRAFPRMASSIAWNGVAKNHPACCKS